MAVSGTADIRGVLQGKGASERVRQRVRQAFPGGSEDQESACSAEDPGSNPGSGRFPCRREWLPTPVFLPGKTHEQRSLVGYSPWGHKESDRTE